MEEKQELVRTGTNGDYEHYELMPSSVALALESIQAEVVSHYGSDADKGFIGLNDDDDQFAGTIAIGGRTYEYIQWGGDNLLPYHVMTMIGKNMVTAQCQQFNTLTCYGQGLQFVDRNDPADGTGKARRASDPELRRFCLQNAIHMQFWRQATDMKYFFFSVMAITLSRDGSKIVRLRQLPACDCRLTRKDGQGRIGHVIEADWRRQTPRTARVYPLLDETDPLGDLLVRMGLEQDPDTGVKRRPTTDRTFAVICRVPTQGRYYPVPYYYSIFLDAWYDIYRLVSVGKRFMIKNTAAPRWQVEIHKNYWNNVCNEEGITDPEKRKERIKKERQAITDFCTKPENAGKAWITSYDTVLQAGEQRMVRIYPLGVSKKEGGDWSDDLSEASNALCFAMGVHPNMVGATPGKSQMNNSGSDKRELFNLKQAIERPWHDVMEVPYHLALHFNGWDERYSIVVPMIEMTTIDKGKEMELSMPGGHTDN